MSVKFTAKDVDRTSHEAANFAGSLKVAASGVGEVIIDSNRELFIRHAIVYPKSPPKDHDLKIYTLMNGNKTSPSWGKVSDQNNAADQATKYQPEMNEIHRQQAKLEITNNDAGQQEFWYIIFAYDGASIPFSKY